MAEDYGIDTFVPADIQARRAGMAAEQGNAAEAQKAYEIAPQTGLPPSIVQYNVPGFQENLQRDQNNTILDGNRRLQNFIIDDPVRAVAAKDNYAELDKMSKIADPSMDLAFQTEGGLADVTPTVKAAGAGVAQGYQERQYGILAHRQLLGEEGLEPALQSYEKQMAGEDEYQGFNYLVNSFGKLVGNIGASAAASAPSFAAGAGVGAAVGGLPGAVVGAGAGLTAGILYDQYKAQAGAFFRESGKVLDRNGNPLPLEVRKAMALGVASVNTMLMGVAPLAAHAGIGAIMSEATLRAISEPGVLNAVTRVLAKAGLGGAEFGAINVGMEASQIAATEIGKATTGQDFNTIVNDPATREAAVQRVTQGLVNGLTLGAVLPFTPLGTNYLRDKIAVAQSNFEARQRDLLHSAVQDSDIFKQAPGLVRDWLQTHEGLEDVRVPAEEVAKNRQAFSYIPDLDTQLETQLPLGGDIVIPAADYYTKTPKEVGTALNEKVRGPSGVTVEEAKDLQENPPAYSISQRAERDASIAYRDEATRQTQEAVENTTEQIMAGMNLQPTGKQTFLNSILENKAAGLDKRTFDQLSKRVQEVQRQITQKAYDVAHAELMRREKPLYKNELAAETERARLDLEKRPDILAYQAMVNLKKDHPFSIKLDRNEVDGLYNRESPADYAAFQKGTRASESFPDKMFSKDGIHPDEAASLIGFSSGKELLDHVREYERAVRESGGTEKQYFEKLVKDEGKRRMEEKDNLNERVSAEAIELALSVKQVDVLIAEMHALVPGEETRLTRDAIQQATEQIFAKVNAKKVKSADYERQVAKWGKEAFSHVTAGKPVEALKSLQKQLSNFLMAREAKAFEKERAKIEGIVQKFQSRKSLDNVSQEYTDRFHSILADLDRPIPVDIRDLEDSLKGKTFERFIADEKERTGKTIADTDWLHGPPGYAAPRMDDLNVEQYRQLAETFESLYELGRKDKQLQIGDKKLDFDVVKERLVRYAKGMVDKRGRIIEKETGIRGTLTRVGRLADATFREPQYIFKRLDADDPTGPWSQDLMRPLYDNENAKHDRLKAIAEDVAKLYDEDWARQSKDLVTNNFLDDRGRPREITQAQKMMMLLHSGNDHNMRLLAHTMGEDVDTVREWLKKNVTEQDLKVAHGVLAEFEKLWPDLRDMTRRVMGVSPAKVRARGYETPAGRFEGGYFPSIRDRDTIEATSRDAIFDRSYFDPATDSRAAHERTGGLYKLSLDLGELPYILRQTVHDIYMREAVENALAIIRDPEIKGAFNDAWGPEYGDQLIPWLRYIANDGSVPMRDGLGAAYWLSRHARQNMVSVLVGGRISTAMIHGLSAASQSVTEVGLGPFVKETLSLISKSKENEKTAWDRAFTYSSAIRNRMHNMYTSLESEVPRMLGQSNARQEYLAFSTRLIAYLDMLSAVVVFNARLKQAMHGGASWDDAVWTANRSVDLAHGSNTIVNRPSIMRGGEGSKWYTQFMGFFNNTYNRMREIGVQVSQGNYMQALIGTIGFMAATSLVHMGVRYNQKEGPGKQLAESVALTVTGGVPIARDAMRGIMGGGDYGEGLVTTTTKGITAPLADLERLVTGKPVSQDWVAHLLQAPGFGMGFLPGISGMGPKVLTGHIGDWLTLATTKAGSGDAQFIYDKFYRHSLEPPDWRRGILEGNFHQRKAH